MGLTRLKEAAEYRRQREELRLAESGPPGHSGELASRALSVEQLGDVLR